MSYLPRDKLIVASTLKEFERWVKSYDGDDKELKAFLLNRLKNIDVDSMIDELMQDVFFTTIKDS